jgi:ABC-type transport system substrate-binding protein
MSFTWARYVSSRISRRRALTGLSLGMAAGAVYLSGCGGDGKGDTSGGSKVYTPVDASAKAKPGGVMRSAASSLGDVGSWDLAAVRSGPEGAPARLAYPGLLKFKAVKAPQIPVGEVEGDVVESYELSPDKLQLTMKLRPGLKWDPRSPTNGREIDAQDVMVTWNRFSKLSAFRGALVYSQAAPDAPVESMSVTDSRTVVFKMRKPNSAVYFLLAQGNTLPVMPKEADGGYDPKTDVRGYGPYILEKYEPSVAYSWRKNPDYYVKGRPFIDRIEQPMVTEYGTRLAQFRSGNIYTNVIEKIEDILPTKRDVPELLLLQDYIFDLSSHAHITFGYEGANNPWRDQRVRQAVSMLIDREAYVELMTQKGQFERDGIPVDFKYPSPLPAGFAGYWLDPTDEKKFGPNAKYLKLNLAEAKKLLTAAGRSSLTTPLLYSAAHANTFPYAELTFILPAMFKEGGITANLEPRDYNSDFLPNIYGGYVGSNNKGFTGMATRRVSPAIVAGQHMFDVLHPSGRAFAGAPAGNGSAKDGDPEVTALIGKYFEEFDIDKQQALTFDYQRQVAEKAYLIQTQIYTAEWTLTWPVVGNHGVFRSPEAGRPSVETDLNLWIDETQAPLRKA